MGISKSQVISVLAAFSVVALIPIIGCGKPDDGLSDEQVKKATRLEDIAKKADGNWDKVPQADRDYLLKTFTSGNEAQAKMLILAKSGKLGGAPGKGAPGGAPGQ